MDSSSTDPTGFIPIDLTTDPLPPLDGGTPTVEPFIVGAGGVPPTGIPGGEVPPSLLGELGGLLSKAQNIGLQGLIDISMALIGALIIEVGPDKPPKWVANVLKSPFVRTEEGLFGVGMKSAWEYITQFADIAFIQPLLKEGLGIDPPADGAKDATEAQAASTVHIVDSMIGFAIASEFSITAIQHVGKAIFADRWPETLQHTLGKIPEEMGLTWALGLVIDRTFEAAFGEALNNYIRSKKRPNEPEWQIARAMLKQHAITEDRLTTILENAGFPDEWIAAIKELETQPIPVGDVQTAYQQGLLNDNAPLAGGLSGGDLTAAVASLSPDQVDYWLVKQGFSDEGRALLKQIYVTKTMTSSGAEIATVYKTLFRNSEVTEAEYTAKLREINYPELLIKDDVAAISKEKEVGWRLQSVAVIKSDYLHNPGDTTTAVTRLQRLGYSKDDALALVNSWTAPPIPRHHGLSEAQILRYMVSGVLTRDQAQPQLQALGLDPGTVTLLLDNPTIVPKVRPQKLTPALVTAAFVAGAVQPSDLQAKLREAGATDETLPYLLAKADYAYTHRHVAGSGVQPLTEGDIKEAFKFGLMSEQDAQIDLEGLGYSPTNARLILEIVNKGPFQPPQPPYFPNVSAAISYLETIGVTVKPGTDPAYDSALGLIIQAGYTYTTPPGFTPPEAPLPVPPPVGVINPPPVQPPPTGIPPPVIGPPPPAPL